MIEINLLPPEHRISEGTPLPRLFSVLAGVIMVTMGGVVGFNYHFVKIKEVKNKIQSLQDQKVKAEKKASEVDQLVAEIVKAGQKVNALRNLELSRILWARLFSEFRLTIPEGCVITNWKVAELGGGAMGAPTGKEYRIELRGYTTGEDDNVATVMWRQLSRNFKKVLKDKNVIAPAPTGQPLNKYEGFNSFLRMKFKSPELGTVTYQGPLPRPPLPADYADFKMPAASLQFNISIPFSVPPLEAIGM